MKFKNKTRKAIERVFNAQYEDKTVSMREAPRAYKLLKKYEKNRLQKVSELIVRKDLDVVDIGCGDGQFLFINKKKWKSVVGIDLVVSLLQQANLREFNVPSSFVNADVGVEKIPLDNRSADLVVCIATMQYLYDLDLVFDEVARILKRGGLFIIEVPNSAAFWRRLFFLIGRFPRTSEFTHGWDAGIIHYFTDYDLSRYIESKDFIIEKKSCSGIFDGLREKWSGLLGGDLIYVCRFNK